MGKPGFLLWFPMLFPVIKLIRSYYNYGKVSSVKLSIFCVYQALGITVLKCYCSFWRKKHDTTINAKNTPCHQGKHLLWAIQYFKNRSLSTIHLMGNIIKLYTLKQNFALCLSCCLLLIFVALVKYLYLCR